VVGRDVKQDRCARVKPRGLRELEARELRHEPAALGAARHLADAEDADVAHGLGGAAVLVEQVRGEGGRGGLAVRSCHGEPPLRALSERELRLADDLVTRRRSGGEEGARLRDPRRGDGEIVVSLDLFGPQDAADARLLEGAGGVAPFGTRSAVERDGVDAAGGQAREVTADPLPRLSDAEDEDVAEFVRVLAGHALELSLAMRCGAVGAMEELREAKRRGPRLAPGP